MQAALSRRALTPRVYRGNLTCKKTVMSGRIKDSFVDFPAFSLVIDRVHCVSMTPFLVRIWCGSARSAPKRIALSSPGMAGTTFTIQSTYGRMMAIDGIAAIPSGS